MSQLPANVVLDDQADFLRYQTNRVARYTMIKIDDLFCVARSIHDKAIPTHHADLVAPETSARISVREAGMPRLVVTNCKKVSSWE